MSELQLPPLALLRLLHLASPGLPVGAYSYSQGLECAIDLGLVRDESSALAWIGEVLELSVAQFEAPVFCRLYSAWDDADATAVTTWSRWFLASRDTSEMRAETVQMGYSLARLLRDLFPADPRTRELPGTASDEAIPYPSAMAAACVMLATPLAASLHACLFSWVENQVLAALKAIPLGQVAGQRMLFALEPRILAAAQTALALEDDELCNWTPGLSLMSMRHETQHSRIFRS